MIDLSIL